MTNVLDQLKQSRVDWQSSKVSLYIFEGVFQGTAVRLRLNDFPDEPLCTVIIDGTETDLDDLPTGWTLPKHRGE
jgi:hypothetical protein